MDEKQAQFNGWAYLAGIFDGEGCVRISKNKAHAGGVSDSYSLQVSIANTDRKLMDFLVNITGGGYTKRCNEKRPNQRNYYSWNVSSLVAARFLRSIRPFTILKSEQIDLAIQFSSRVRRSPLRLSSNELAHREDMRLRLSAMKGIIRGTR